MADEEVFIYKQEPDYSILRDHGELAADFLLQQLSALIKPGNKVVLKPNFVKESHLTKKADWEYVITHTEVIRLVLDAVIKALGTEGEVCIVDAPQTDSDYQKLFIEWDCLKW